MKTAGPQGEPAASISISTPAIIAPLPHNPNSSSTTTGVPSPIADARPFDLDDLDALLDDIEIDLPASARANFDAEVGKLLKTDPASGTPSQTPQKPMAQGLSAHSHAPENGPSSAASVYIGGDPLSLTPQTEPKKTKRQQLKDEAAERRKARAAAKKAKKLAKRQASFKRYLQIENARFKHASKDPGDILWNEPEHRTLPRWKDLGVKGRALAAHDALMALGYEVYAFSLELDDETIAAAHAARSFSTFIHGRIAYQLAKRFPGPQREFALVVEVRTSTGNRPHPHLELACTSDEIPAVLELLAEAGGRGWKPKRRGDRQAVVSMKKDADGSMRPRRPDDNWLAGYASKDVRYTSRKLKGSPFASTRTLNDSAHKLFDAWRKRELATIESNESSAHDVTNRLSPDNGAAVAEIPLVENQYATQEEVVNLPSESKTTHANAPIPSSIRDRRNARRPRRRRMRWHARFRAVHRSRWPVDRARAAPRRVARGTLDPIPTTLPAA